MQVDPSVSAAVHNVAALYNKARQDFAGYYRAALQYLCFVSIEDLPLDDRIALARDISLAALLGDSIYSFAELLLHPVVRFYPIQFLEVLLCAYGVYFGCHSRDPAKQGASHSMVRAQVNCSS